MNNRSLSRCLSIFKNNKHFKHYKYFIKHFKQNIFIVGGRFIRDSVIYLGN